VLWRSLALTMGVIAFWLGIPGYAGAAPSPSEVTASRLAEAFLQSAEALYQATAGGSGENVHRLLRETEVRFRSLPMQRIASAEGIEALANSIARMKRLTAAVSPDETKWPAAAAEIRLAADALAHPDKPVWHGYLSVLREDIGLIAMAIHEGDVARQAAGPLSRLKSHYGMIRTAALLHAEPYVAERADSVLRYAERVLGAQKPDPSLLNGLVGNLRDAMEGLFPQVGKNAYAPVAPLSGPPWGWSALMGSFIVTVLSWAGWQRYRHTENVTPRGSPPPERHERH
jgi:sporulation protein YpjB